MARIKYPELKSTPLTIGITAPSSGLSDSSHKRRFELVIKQHRERGIKVIKGKCLGNKKYPSSDTPQNRAKDFMSLWNNPAVSIVQPPWGGEHLIDMLEHIDFKAIKLNPTWIQGYSDLSTLLFAITTMTGVATAHGSNFIDSIDGQEPLTTHSRDYVHLKKKGTYSQQSSQKWQETYTKFADKTDATFNLTKKTRWKLLNSTSSKIKATGRIIGGCIDTLVHLRGTPYGDLPRFHKRYASGDGLIIFLENCEQTPLELYRSLVAFKYAGWFDNANAIILGRNAGPESKSYPYLKCLKNALGNMKIPVILDADIGHKPPQMTIINGSLATLTLDKGKAKLVQHLV